MNTHHNMLKDLGDTVAFPVTVDFEQIVTKNIQNLHLHQNFNSWNTEVHAFHWMMNTTYKSLIL